MSRPIKKIPPVDIFQSPLGATDANIRAGIIWVSAVSQWTDRKWIFDGKAIGSNKNTVTCIWDFELLDGSTLFDQQHSRLLHDARSFLWSLYSDRRNGRALKPSAVGTVFHGLRQLLKWMVENNYAGFDELDNRASERYCDWLVDFYAAASNETFDELDNIVANDIARGEPPEDDLDAGEQHAIKTQSISTNDIEGVDCEDIGGVTATTFSHSLTIWRYLWEQRVAMSRVGIKTIQEAPFSGRSPSTVAVELAPKLTRRIPPIPDAVAIALMNAAHKFIATAADDVTKALEGLFPIRHTSRAEIAEFFQNFRFSLRKDNHVPWHEPFETPGTSSVEVLRRLTDDLVDACVIIAQAETGMRIGELSALPAGLNEQTGLPVCVTKRPSKSGMLDLYYLKSKLNKLRPKPVDEEWLLAAAPRGTKELPDAVRAIVVLQNLLTPLRALAEPDVGQYLLITLGVPRGFPTSSAGVTEPNNHLLRLGQKSFAKSYVEWSEIGMSEETRPYIESQGRCIRPHQWRKTYAVYVFQVDKRMLPAIARQFKHLSLAMTEGAYVGTSASLVAGVADFNRNLTTEFFLSNVRGTASKQEGRLAKLMAQYQPELRKIVEGMDSSSARAAIDEWCSNRDMKIFFHGYGKCIPAVAPLQAECHKRAGTVHWANNAPNFSRREPSICTGCYLFLSDKTDIDHWKQRYTENMSIWMQEDKQGRGNEYRVAKTRADQAKIFLVNLGAPIPLLEKTDER